MLSKQEQQNLIQLSMYQTDEIEQLKRENKTLRRIQTSTPASLTVEKIIHVTEKIGDGTAKNPVRLIHNIYDMNGKLLTSFEN